jgi:hypothetical protein
MPLPTVLVPTVRSFLGRVAFELGSGRALANAGRALVEEELTHRSIDALARRIAPAPIPRPRWHAA